MRLPRLVPAVLVIAALISASPASAQTAGDAYSGSGGTDGSEPAPPVPDGATSPGAEGSAESVIGADGRTQVLDTTVFPSRAIGQLTFDQDGSTNFLCTGWLIDPNTVVTSGHCVHNGSINPDSGQPSPPVYSTNMVFAPGRNGGTDPFGTCGATELFAPATWRNQNANANDYGVVQLDCEVGDTVGWFGYRARSYNALVARPITVRGYPGTPPEVIGTMWTMDDVVRGVVSGQIRYQADTAPGQSGSPVYEATGCGGPCGLAVHSYGCPGGEPCAFPNNFNSGPRLTQDRVDTIYDFAAENDPHPDAKIKRSGGSFRGNNRYNRTGNGQERIARNLAAGAIRDFYVNIENEGLAPSTFTIDGDGSSNHFRIRYYRNGRNITGRVNDGIYQIANLAAGADTTIRIEIKAKNSSPGTARVTSELTVTDTTSPFYRDVVLATARR